MNIFSHKVERPASIARTVCVCALIQFPVDAVVRL